MMAYINYYENQKQHPCPKCGSKKYGYEWEHWDYKKNRALDAYIICRACRHRTRTHKSVETAQEEWDREYRGGLEA